MNEPEAQRSWWPYGLIATFAVFITWIAIFIATAVRQDMDLVRPDYYAQEIQYQDQIDRLNRTAALNDKVSIRYHQKRQSIEIQLPLDHVEQGLTGFLKLYRPSDADLDRDLELKPDAKGLQWVDAGDLQKGLWKLMIRWQVNGEEYYSDQSLVIDPGMIALNARSIH